MNIHTVYRLIICSWLVLGLMAHPATLPATPAVAHAAQGANAHYIVFETRPDGSAAPLFYRPVRLSAPLIPLSEAQAAAELAQPARNTRPILVTLYSPAGEIIYRDVVTASRWLRGEFHAQTPGDPIDGYLFPLESASFVVRLPLIEGASLKLESANRVMGVFDLEQVKQETPAIDLNALQVIANPTQPQGSPANRVDFLIMGDGYTSGQAAQFATDAAAVAAQFFSISPYAEYMNYINIHTLFSASAQAGADHPPYQAGCTAGAPTCCGDPDAASDPYQGMYANTAFDSTFCYFNIHRLLVPNYSKVFAAAAAVPDWDTILLLINDPVYGGSGGLLSAISMHSAAAYIAQHEYGHSFTDLADEYETAYPGFPPCSDAPGSTAPCEANVTDINIRAQIKWLPWILSTTPIPTPNHPAYDGLVGLFEGARYQATGMYRSGYNCIMRSLGAPYCQVPSQAYVLKLYNGGWGTPAQGISLIEPGTLLPASPSIHLTHPATQVFHADVLSPVGGPPTTITWLVNGSPVLTGTQTYTYTTSAAGTFEVALQVEDVTPLVNPGMAGNALKDSYTWQVYVDEDARLELSTNSTTLLADGHSTSLITATLATQSSPQAGVTVTFTTTLGSLAPLSGVTNAAGVVTATLTSTTTLGRAVILASTATATDTLWVDFVAGPPASLTLGAAPDTLLANGIETSTITVQVNDAVGHPLAGVTVTFTATLGSLQPITTTTDSNGTAIAHFTAGTTAGTATITASAGTLSNSTDIHLVAPPRQLYLPLIRRP